MGAPDPAENRVIDDGLLSSQLRHRRQAMPITRQPLRLSAEILAAANSGDSRQEQQQTRLALCCLLAKGHLLIEDLPGVGKTTLAHTLARLLGFQFARVQFTSDMLPADILGVSIFDRERGSFRFLPGPVFSQVLLADEINRATPKTQSALLEAMEEGQVTTEGETRPLPQPFFVIATQNPSNQIGTFPLPESQLDRFLLRIELGYPDHDAERALLESGGAASSCRR
jgi:MoxR-like ATPase